MVVRYWAEWCNRPWGANPHMEEVAMELAGNNPSAVSHLVTFLGAPERAEETLSYHGLQGFLFAVATAPELVPPSKWLPAIWGEDEGQEEVGQAEMERVLAGIMTLYNRINAEVLEDRVGLPADLAVDPDPWANLGPEAPLGQWSAGFSRGMGLVEPMWDECLPWAPEAMFPGFAYWVVRLSMFAGREYGDGLVQALEPDRGSLETWLGPALERFEEHMADLAEFGRRTAEALAEFDAEEEEAGVPDPLGPSQPIRREKVGRNEPCPCGSGRKYKKCCLGAGSGGPR